MAHTCHARCLQLAARIEACGSLPRIVVVVVVVVVGFDPSVPHAYLPHFSLLCSRAIEGYDLLPFIVTSGPS